MSTSLLTRIKTWTDDNRVLYPALSGTFALAFKYALGNTAAATSLLISASTLIYINKKDILPTRYIPLDANPEAYLPDDEFKETYNIAHRAYKTACSIVEKETGKQIQTNLLYYYKNKQGRHRLGQKNLSFNSYEDDVFFSLRSLRSNACISKVQDGFQIKIGHDYLLKVKDIADKLEISGKTKDDILCDLLTSTLLHEFHHALNEDAKGKAFVNLQQLQYFVPAILSCLNSSSSYLTIFSSFVLGGIMQFHHGHYVDNFISRQREHAADVYSARCGYKKEQNACHFHEPSTLPNYTSPILFYRVLLNITPKSLQQHYWQTHPDDDARINRVNELVSDEEAAANRARLS